MALLTEETALDLKNSIKEFTALLIEIKAVSNRAATSANELNSEWVSTQEAKQLLRIDSNSTLSKIRQNINNNIEFIKRGRNYYYKKTSIINFFQNKYQ